MKRASIFIIIFVLASCTTPEQQAAIKAQQQQDDYNACIGYGFRPKSDAFKNCLLELDIARQQRNSHPYDSYPRFHYGFYHYR